ncbi:nucleotidyl transferase AbiEii/AbiGii toxin family protein [Epilithonimonas ginsengisoli]|uniref:Nucleotidyl transferase AbiEii/AbiGii toxin family protein n=1 Tax=Epilithonimonas ginsengisoli TaxID=1245592 RepID=A0ABU4JHE5_9FLAO|nr:MULTISPECIES: nucleotidyl transferase AbiEii/AbiGii toxin family protein [Chryseobacterium group]MDW8549075.1 nucleotidyl transferase AbiEii/AbiGii toxin family protein [Epilithonimonas ginsengisoli]
MSNMYYNTVNELLKNSLQILMAPEVFKDFRLVGGTSLSLQLGHRMSIDIDLFSDAIYRSIDFNELDIFLRSAFTYVDSSNDLDPAMGKSYLIGTDKDNTVKLDIYYTDTFIRPVLTVEAIRLATIEEIIAMKIDVVHRGGRKKDFWDLHECLSNYGIGKMLELHEERYPYSHDRDLILKNFIDFTSADDDFDPICLQGKYWEFIKEDIEEAVNKYQKS